MRIIYNTSFIIDEDIETAWIGFIRKNYISVLQTNRLCEILSSPKYRSISPKVKLIPYSWFSIPKNNKTTFWMNGCRI